MWGTGDFEPIRIENEEEEEEEEVVVPEPEPIVFLKGFEGSRAESERILMGKSDYLTTMFFQEQRHVQRIEGVKEFLDHDIWTRFNGKERMKTVSVALILCLHLGVDPPDPEPKPKERCRIEAWLDPRGWSPAKATSAIGFELQNAYTRWQPRARYKVSIDPTLDEIKKICTSMRRNAKEERVLFHYNGHGVPRPTQNGEIWVFNPQYTQYIPVSICTLQTWLEFPCVYVWDCSSAGNCIENFIKFGEQHQEDWEQAFEEFKEKREGPLPPITSGTPYIEQARLLRFHKPPNFKECVHMAACAANERLPVDPRLPADLFTACLTTPIQSSILWYLLKLEVRHKFPEDIFAHIPGQLTDRRTLMGELNWIFTAVTDTIAWNCLPRDIFQKLFRQDLLLASLFRSYLLAEKIMGDFGCTVQSIPKLPGMRNHPLWLCWETTLDYAIDFLDKMIYGQDPRTNSIYLGYDVYAAQKTTREDIIDHDEIELGSEQPHQFFVQQMRAFQTWLEGFHDRDNPPEQLPVVLQVLLSQQHRTHALELLSKFLDLGTWAVGYALSVGIFPYILKLLQSSQRDLKPWLSFIWAKILAVEPDINKELFQEIGDDNVYNASQRPEMRHLRVLYFLQILNDPAVNLRQKIVVAYVIATLNLASNAEAHMYLCDRGFVTICTEILADPDARDVHLLRVWLLIGLGNLWTDFNVARWQAVRLCAHQRAITELSDPVAEVRASACFALGSLMKNHSHTNEHATVIDQECADAIINNCIFDGSNMVREEMIMALQFFVIDFEEVLCKYFLNLLKTCDMDIEKEMLDEDVDDSVDVIAEIEAAEDRERDGFTAGWKRRVAAAFSQRARGWSNSTLFTKSRRFSSSFSEGSRNRDKDEPTVHGPDALPLRDRIFRVRVMKQIENLERRTFKDPFERIWMALLRITHDPVPKLAALGQFLVRHVEEAALELHVSTERRLVTSVSLHSFNIKGKSADSSSQWYSPDRNGLPPATAVRKGSFDNRGQLKSSFIVPTTPARKSSFESRRPPLPPSALQHQQPSTSQTPPQLPSPQQGRVATTTSTDSGPGTSGSDGEEGGLQLKLDRSVTHTPNLAPITESDQENRGRSRSPQPGPSNQQSQIRFIVGSPNSANPPQQPPQSQTSPNHQQQSAQQTPPPNPKLVKPALSTAPAGARDFLKWKNRQPPSYLRIEDFDKNAILAKGHHFVAKRTMTGRTGGSEFKAPKPHPKANDPMPIYEPMLDNDYVQWLAKMFSEPCINLVMDDYPHDGIGDRMNTVHNPTLWALKEQRKSVAAAAEESDAMRRGYRMRRGPKRGRVNVDSNAQLLATRNERITVSASFSQLRPYMYSTDGEYVQIYKYDRQGCRVVRRWHNYNGNNFMIDRSTYIQSINTQSREMLVVGSENGLVRVWNPHFDLHDDEFESQRQPELMAAFNPIASGMRFPFDYKQATKVPALYNWDQDSGRLIIAGATKVVRLWDAHCEKNMYEIMFDHKKHSKMTALAADMGRSHLFAVAFDEGLIRVYDQRLKPKEARIFSLFDLKSRVKGVAIRTNEAGTKLSAGFKDGHIFVYEPRMFQEPVVQLQLGNNPDDFGDYTEYISHFDVHLNGQIMTTVTTKDEPEVTVYDISGKVITHIRHNEIEGRHMSTPTCVALHPLRPLVGVATSDRYLSAYGVASK